MAGLLSPRGDGVQGTTLGTIATTSPTAASAAEPMMDDEAPNVSPEEQAAYEQFVANGLNLVFNERTMPAILELMQKAPNPITGLANSTVMVVKRLKDSAQANGKELDPSILLHGGIEIMENIADMAAAAGIHNFSQEEKEKAVFAALDQYATMELQAGNLDPEPFAQEFQMILEADRQGRLNEVLPGIEEFAQRVASQQELASASEQRG